jgi:hypothetical protein
MNTITPEIRKQIFAQYFGNIYYYKNEFGNFKEKVEFGYHTNKHIENDNAFLYLTPLSNMTDDDAIEAIQMNMPEKYKELKIISKQDNDIHYSFQPNRGGRISGFLDCNELLFNVYQYLLLKGYALPYMDYSVEELVQLGIYKLKK